MGKRIVSGSFRYDQRYRGGRPLDFDNFSDGGAVRLSDSERASVFLSEFQQHVDPFVTYKSFWDNSRVSVDVTLKHVKDLYIHFVCGVPEWSEDEFVSVLDKAFRSHQEINYYTFDKIMNGFRDVSEPVRVDRVPTRRRDL